MKKNIKQIAVFLFLISLMVLPSLVLAESSAFKDLKQVGQVGENAPYVGIEAGRNDLAGVVGIVIQGFLGLLGVLFLSYMLYAGYTWMSAQGDEEKVTKAKDTIMRAIVGLIVTIAAYAISYWVFDRLLTNTDIIR